MDDLRALHIHLERVNPQNCRSVTELASTMAATTRFLTLPGESLSDTAELVIQIQPSVVADLALELSLLLSGLTESLRIRSGRGPTTILSLIDNDRIAKALAFREPDGSARFAIGKNQAEYLSMVLLRAHRDHMAEVSHIHIEGECDGAPFDLTLMFDVFRELMSPEDVDKLLRES